ncbi:type I polyketide synthase [Antrihabitans cavernicola]|nr:type I polyketide synthase [Spelaeibacter cavernicola]
MPERIFRAPTRRLADNPIAIVGMSGLFPKARNAQEFWRNVVDARDCIEDVSDLQWSTEHHFHPDPAARDKTYCRRGGFLPPIDFDTLKLGMPPALLPSTDIVQLLSLVVARDLLQDAKAVGADWYRPADTGVVLGISGTLALTIPLSSRLQAPVVAEAARSVGLSEHDAGEIAERFSRAYVEWDEASFPGVLGNVVAGRIANRLNLGGINCTVDAACASSLAAMEVAVRELVDGRQDMMLTGGCSVDNTVFAYMAFSKTPALSRSGRVRPFDGEADGTLLGDGIGMIALRRLESAQRDGNRIYAVLRGLGAANDGRSGSIYAPQKGGQVLALQRAYADANVSPASIGLFEAHGTGTRAGDRTELSSLTHVVDAVGRPFTAAVGSVKSQIGHTKAAAGAAGVIKAAYALHQRVLPPTINVTRPTEGAASQHGLYINTLARPWIHGSSTTPRRAAVSAFGFGGTNFHVVLEEYLGGDAAPKVVATTAKVAIWYAANAEALAEVVTSGSPAADDVPVPAAAARIGFVYRNPDEFASLRGTTAKLLKANPGAAMWKHPEGIVGFRVAKAKGGKVAALFSGQGSQYINMGRTATLNVPPVREAFEALAQCGPGEALLPAIAFPPPAFDDAGRDQQDATLRRTEHAQPLIGALSAGQYNWLKELGFTPDGLLGHSFGELTALWAAGAIDGPDFYALAVARGNAMAPPSGRSDFDSGAMAALTASASEAAELVNSYSSVSICNYNGPGQVVVGGSTAHIERVLDDAQRRGLRATRLPVSAAFHTPFVGHAVDTFRNALRGIEMRPPKLPVFANTTGATYGDDLRSNKHVLVEQLRQPVDFGGRLAQMYEEGYRVFVEFGPRSTLTRMVERTLADKEVVCLATDVGPDVCSDVALKRAAMQLRLLGLPILDINRYESESLSASAGTAASVELLGVNYVPKSASESYAANLAAPYVLTSELQPKTRPRTETLPATTSSTRTVRDAAGSAGKIGVNVALDLNQVVQVQMALNDKHLDSQLQTIRGLIAAVSNNVGRQSSDDLRASLSVIDRYGLLVAETQAQAGHSLRSFVADQAINPRDTTQDSGSQAAAPALPIPAAVPTAVPVVPAPEAAAPAAAAVARPVTDELPPMPLAPNGHGAESVSNPATGNGTPASKVAADSDVVDQARAVLLEVVAEKTGYPVEMLDSEMDIEADLGVDSIKRVEIVSQLQPRFPGVRDVPAQRLGELRTLDDVVNLLIGLAPATPAVAESIVDELLPMPLAPNGHGAESVSNPVTGNGTPASKVAADSDVVDQARAVLLEVVAEKTGYPVEMLDSEMDIEADLGVDSIKRVEIVSQLQPRFPGVRDVPAQRLGELRTLDDVVNLLVGLTPASPAEDPLASSSGIGRSAVGYEATGDVVNRGKAFAASAAAMIIDDGAPLTTLLVAELRSMGLRTFVIAIPGTRASASSEVLLDSWDEANLAAAVAAAIASMGRLDLCVQVAVAGPGTTAAAVERLTHAVLVAKLTQRHLQASADDGRSAFLTVTQLDGSAGLGGAVPMPDCLLGGLGGLVKTLAIEAPELFCRAIDVRAGLPGQTVRSIFNAELCDANSLPREVGHDGVVRRTLALREWNSRRDCRGTTRPPSATDLVVVTGGARGVTAGCAAELADRFSCALLILGRTLLFDEPAWARGLVGAALKSGIIAQIKAEHRDVVLSEVELRFRTLIAQREVRDTMDRLSAYGVTAQYIAVDIQDSAAVTAALGPYRERITGLVHGAGVLADRLIADKRTVDVERVLATKLAGLDNVLASLNVDALTHVALFSSVAGVFGNKGQADYAIANEALNRICMVLNAGRPEGRAVSINWGPWDGGMVTRQLRDEFERRGVVLVPLRAGASIFADHFAAEFSDDALVLVGPTANFNGSTADLEARAGSDLLSAAARN